MARTKRTRVAIHIPSRVFELAQQDAATHEDSVSGILANIIIAHYNPIIEAKRAQENQAFSNALKEAAKPTKEVKEKKKTQKELLSEAQSLAGRVNRILQREAITFEDLGVGLALMDRYEMSPPTRNPEYMVKYLNTVYYGAINCTDEDILHTMLIEGNFTEEFYNTLVSSESEDN